MSYLLDINPKCKQEIKRHCRKNPVLEKAIKNKMNEILQNPYHYKPMKYDLVGERRVHILKSFVLKYGVDEQRKTVIFIFFGHHDEAYKR
ncbi:MAG: type II toxin-antitoxin system RelE/ParE family toxin [Candidatus Pacearchaeota archaeon]|nr:type II toxin-antitoxin system RelE/ParE family toxin [Candidatus Pacearchaeota archaeon]